MTKTLAGYLATLSDRQMLRQAQDWALLAAECISSSRARGRLEGQELVNITMDRLARGKPRDACPDNLTYDAFFAVILQRELQAWIQREVRRRRDQTSIFEDNAVSAADALSFEAWQLSASQLSAREMADRSLIIGKAARQIGMGDTAIRYADMLAISALKKLPIADIAAQLRTSEDNIYQIRARFRKPRLTKTVLEMLATGSNSLDSASDEQSNRE